ncbi:MAG: hypothetical protein M1833_004209 [Piccolia ochrophora]|nr:MAG: hypothetical protein M1833_004209 [Piccolia ochrophora]
MGTGHRSTSPSSAEKDRRRRSHKDKSRRNSSTRSSVSNTAAALDNDRPRRESIPSLGVSPYAGAKGASASVLSTLSSFSGLTTASGGSSGSNSTITQDSVSKSRRASPKQVKADERENEIAVEEEDLQVERTEDTSAKKALDVFSFLEDSSSAVPIAYKHDEPTSADVTRTDLSELGPESELKNCSNSFPITNSHAQHETTPPTWPHHDWLHHQTQQMPPNVPEGSDLISFQPQNVGDVLEHRSHVMTRSAGSSSLHSDSGISIRDESPDGFRDGADKHVKMLLSDRGIMRPACEPNQLHTSGQNNNENNPRHHQQADNRDHISWARGSFEGNQDTSRLVASHEQSMPWMQETASALPHPSRASRRLASLDGQSGQASHRQRKSYTSSPRAQDKLRPTITGYELLASSISSRDGDSSDPAAPLVPLYRKFEHLNNRLLLHLQDELAELEEELRLVDEAEAQSRAAASGADPQESPPESRRTSAKFGGELHWMRLDILGRIFTKLGQYNHALSSYKSLVKDLDPAETEDVERYRAWLAKTNPIAPRETSFVQHDNDLVSLRKSKSPYPTDHVAATSSHASYQDSKRLALSVLSVAVLFPVLAFTVFPWFSVRLVIVVGAAASAMAVLAPTTAGNLMGPGEWGRCVALYVGIMTAAAAYAQ